MTKKEALMARGQLASLCARIHEIEPYLEMEGRFRAVEVDVENPDALMRWLNQEGAVRKVDTERVGPANRPVYIWQWNEEIKDALEQHLEGLNKLPRDHKSHIWNPPDQDGLSCKFCDDNPTYSRETVKDCL